tara:strand:- start:49 stop:249 length:201 start_codon:yes stop_codon:yes gene_type:complete
MKLHHTVIEHLINLYSQYGGFRNETRLKQELANVQLSEYVQVTKGGNSILVLTEQLNKEKQKAERG